MTMQAIFGSTLTNARSTSLNRKLRLLQFVLPIFLTAAHPAREGCKRWSPDRKFWTHFITSCLLISDAEWSFNKVADGHAGLVEDVLRGLEHTIHDGRKTGLQPAFLASEYPHLDELRSDINIHAGDADYLECRLNGQIQMPTEIYSRPLISALSALAKLVEEDEPPPPPEQVARSSRSKLLANPLLLNIFSAIASCLQCKCSAHSAILPLATHRAGLKSTQLYYFTLLLSRKKPSRKWQEIDIAVKETFPVAGVRIIEPGSSTSSQPSHVICDICRTIEACSGNSIKLNVVDKTLHRLVENSSHGSKNFEDVYPVGLATTLFWKDQISLSRKTKACMSLVLSYSLLDYCGEPLFPEGWTSDGVYLLERNKTVILQPALVACMHTSTRGSKQAASNERRLLQHAVLLMEIFMQDRLQLKLDPNIEVARSLIRQQFDNIPWEECERYRQAVEACIDGDEGYRLGPTHSAHPDDAQTAFQGRYFARVIDPLEADFATLWGDDADPDRIMSALTCRARPPTPRPKSAAILNFVKPLKPSSLSKLAISRPRAPAHQIQPLQHIKFFDTVDKPDQKQVDGGLRWFRRFDQETINGELPQRGPKGQRVKIAVLDTGIDLSNEWIASKAGMIKCWPRKADCMDTDGHGTHVAYLLLRLVAHAELHVAKINDSQTLTASEIETTVRRIADAITHFSTVERVDIINISFGFPKFHPALRPILAAIRLARANGVVTFAAAGNEGRNESAYWPAVLRDEVIRINATDGDGNPSSFNPNLPDSRRICTLGEGVPSCERQITHRNGTSFAAPIAVATMAIVLGFADEIARKVAVEHAVPKAEDGEHPNAIAVPENFTELMAKLRTKSGMEAVLCETCVQSVDRSSSYSYIAPWFFLEADVMSRIGVITNLLRNVPE